MSLCAHSSLQHTAGASSFPATLLRIAMVALLLCVSSQVLAGSAPDRVFAHGFEVPLAGYDDIRLRLIATSDPTCPDSGPDQINTRPGVPVRFCYRLINNSDARWTIRRSQAPPTS